MDIDIAPFQAPADAPVDLAKRPTKIAPLFDTKEDYRKKLGRQIAELSAQQELLYASNAHAVLVIFQAMDAAGKDGAIKHVMFGVNPQGCRVTSFKHPSATELKHDFLWRSTCELPERGQIGIFNRSYYEEVLVVRVHPEILRAEGVPDDQRDAADDDTIWKRRFRSIVDLERHLHRNGTRIIKFFLHLSPQEQRKRFLDRIDDPEKNWKFNAGDIDERRFWQDYMRAYEACLTATSTPHAPWWVVPADGKKNARLLISEILVETMKSLKMAFPHPSAERRAELLALRAALEAEPARP